LKTHRFIPARRPTKLGHIAPHFADQTSIRCSQSPLVRGQSDRRLTQLANGSREWNRQSASPPHKRQGCDPETLIQSASSPSEEGRASYTRTRASTWCAIRKPSLRTAHRVSSLPSARLVVLTVACIRRDAGYLANRECLSNLTPPANLTIGLRNVTQGSPGPALGHQAYKFGAAKRYIACPGGRPSDWLPSSAARGPVWSR
jgi:hypothetical protein